jgi:Ubiquitin-2 like Rad60 SUMO-like
MHANYVWHIDASDLATFEYLREHRHERPPPIADGPSQSSSPSGSAEEDARFESDAQSMAEGDDDDVFKLVVRSGVTKDVTLKVRPTTTCGAIVKAFLRRAGIADKYSYSEGKSSRGKSAASSPRLMIDGEHMNPDIPISEADLEDGDQVEVTGL